MTIGDTVEWIRGLELTTIRRMTDRTLSQDIQRAMGIILRQDAYSKEEAEQITAETVQYWKESVNPGFLDYRKSVSTDFTAIEWRDGTPGGVQFISLDGKEYLDFLGGFGIFSCGHRHPKIIQAVKAQLEKQALHTQELLDPLRAYGAHLLSRITPGDLQYCFFTNSGTESVEAALKSAMLATKRHQFLACVGAFHGKTLGSLGATSKNTFRQPFAPALVRFTHVPINDITSLERVFKSAEFSGETFAGFIIEPVLGEGGIHIVDPEYLRAARRLCTQHGTLLIFDEVQSGLGRTGKWFACDHAGVAPDIMTVAKALGGGVMPVGACIVIEKVWEEYFKNPFLFTTTFGGNPLAMAAMIATISVIHEEDLVSRSAQNGASFLQKLRGLQRRYPSLVQEVRGLGMMIGMEFCTNEIGYDFSKGCFRRGVVVSGTLINSKTVRIEPALNVGQKEIETCLRVMDETLQELQNTHPAKL